MKNFDHGIDFDVKDWDEMRAFCDETCGRSCEKWNDHEQTWSDEDYQNQEHCERTSFHGYIDWRHNILKTVLVKNNLPSSTWLYGSGFEITI